MTRRGVLALSATGVASFPLVACARRFPTYRYRMTVEVETPQGLRSGSSVIEVSTSGGGPTSGLLPWTEVNSDVRGEAVAVDVARGRTLFALLKSASGDIDAAMSYAGASLPPSIWRASESAFAENLAELVSRRDVGVLPIPAHGDEIPKSGVPSKPFPLLVTFRDVRDPKSVERVDPANLAATFGRGVALRRITVEITDASVTKQIEKRLGWLERSAYGGLDLTSERTGAPTFAQQLGFLDFRRK